MNRSVVKRMGIALVAMSLVLVSCGGSGSAANPTGGKVAPAASPAETSGGGPGATEYPIQPAIEDLPLLDPHEVPTPGSAHSADIDPQQRVSQYIVYRQGMREIFEFYLAELPAAGYEIYNDGSGAWVDMTDFVENSDGHIAFRNQAGQKGSLFFRSMTEGGVQMNVNLIRG